MGHRPAIALIRAFLIGFLFTGSAQADIFRLESISGGLNDAVPGHLIADGEAVEVSNFHIDPVSGALIQRGGSSKRNATQLAGKKAVDPFTYIQDDGDEYLVSIASKTIAYSTDNGSTWTTLITTATDGAIYDGVSFRDTFYMVSQNDGGLSFNGTAISTVSAMPSGKYIEKYQNRLWVANTASANNRLYYSGLLQPSTWTTSTDFIDFPEPIVAIGRPYDGGLPIYTENQTWMVRGSAPSNFSVQQISDVIGCAHNRTIQNFTLAGREYQIFMSKGPNQTENNLYALNGVTVQPIGDRVLTLLSAVAIGNVSLRQQLWDSQSDFSAGTISSTSYTNVSGSVVISTNNTNLQNNSFETAFSSEWTAGGTARTTDFAQGGSVSVTDSVLNVRAWTGFYLELLDGSGTTLESQSYTSSDFTESTWVQKTKTFSSSHIGKDAKVRFRWPAGNTLTSETITFSGAAITFYLRNHFAPGPNSCILYVDLVEGGRSTISSGTYTSQDIQADSDFSQWGTFDADYNLNGGTIDFYVKTATDSSSLAAAAFTAITPGTQISTTTNRFFKWKAEFVKGSATNINEVKINQVTANWTSGSGNTQPLGSVVFKNDYWLTYTGGSQSRNQSILLMNSNGAFSTLTGLNAYGFTVSQGRLFAGDSSTDTVNGGYLWEYETGTTDAGTAVTAQVTLKHQSFPQAEDYTKNLSKVLFNYAVDVGTFTWTTLENFSEYSQSDTVYFSSGTAYNRWQIEPDLLTEGRTYGLRFTNSYPGTCLKLYPPIIYHYEKVSLIQ